MSQRKKVDTIRKAMLNCQKNLGLLGPTLERLQKMVKVNKAQKISHLISTATEL